MIDILVPVLGRPQNAQTVYDSAMQTAQVPVEVLFLTSPRDFAQIQACEQTGAKVMQVVGAHHQYPLKMNAGYAATEQPFLLLGADDIEFVPGWDTVALEAAEHSGAGVIGLNDQANALVKRGVWSTHPLVRRSYIAEQGGSLEGPGHLLSLRYDHNYCERELCHLAEARGLWIFCPQAKVRHKHPAWGTAEPDATYAKGFRRFARDRQMFLRRAPGWGCVGLQPVERRRTRCS